MKLPLPPIIPAKLRQFERERKWSILLEGAAGTLLVFCLGLVLLILLEWTFRPRFTARASLSGLNYFLTVAFLTWRVLVPLAQRRRLRDIAWTMETAACGHFHERIVSAVELSESEGDDQPGVSSWMRARTIELAAEEISAAKPAALLDRSAARMAWKRAAGGLLVLGLLCLVPGFGARLWLALDPYASTAALSRVQLAVEPGNWRLKQGAPLEIKATGPNLPEEAKAIIKWDDGFQETVLMSRSQTNVFSLGLAAVSQGFRYSVQAGDAESPLFTVKVDVPPRIARLQLLIEPPAYTGWTNRLVEGGGADFLVGSRVKLLLETADEKVSEAEWLADTAPARKHTPENDRLTLELQLTNPVAYQIRLTGENRLQFESSQRWTLRPLADAPPAARLVFLGTAPGMVQRDEILPLQAFASDDVALKRADLVVLTKDAEIALKPIYQADHQRGSREVREAINYNLADLDSLAGDEIQFQLIATDVRDQTTRSEPLAFTVGAPDKALEAQLAARLRQLISALVAQTDDLQQTRASWLSIGRNYREAEAGAPRPALTVLKSRLQEFGREIDRIGQRLTGESESNNIPEARFMYRLGSTVSAWGLQQREVLLANCSRIETSANAYDTFSLGRELFSRALMDLDQYKRAVSVLADFFETDVLALRCESAQGRYKRGLPVLRGENVIAPLGKGGSGLMATFFEGTSLNGKVLEQKVENPRFDNYAPGGRREQWSVRYEGDLNLSEESEWTLACVADDGVRLAVQGKSLLPEQAWSAHGATQYKADLKFTAGWHPITIEFFQGSSESKLQFLAGRKGQPLQEVPVQWLRPPLARITRADLATNTILNSVAQGALKDRIRSSLATPSSAPVALAPMTNDVPNENFARIVREKWPIGTLLASNLPTFASWNPDESHKAEEQADALTALTKDAQRLLKEELEKYRWRYEGAAALKEVQNAVQELREITQELRQQPYHSGYARTDQEQAKVQLAKAWEQELKRAATETAHQLFETAKQKEATLAERVTALSATTKIEKELQPAIARLAATLEENRGKDDLAGHVEQRLNETNDRYRELNDLQEKINREQVAAEARKALPSVRAFERVQKAQPAANLAEQHEQMKGAVAGVLKAQRVAGDYQEAEKLQNLAGNSPQSAKAKETTQLVRDLANRTDRNVPSLAQSIPPPMREETQALQQQHATPKEAANSLAQPRLAMALESSRLAQQSDRKTAVAYGLLGEDLGALLEAPEKLNPATLQPLTDRAAALAGEKGEEARQAEIRAALERATRLAAESPDHADALAGRLDEMSVLAKQAAGEALKRQPLNSQLNSVSKLAPPVPNWSDSTDAREIAASAAHESSDEIQAAPNQGESYNEASQMLADAARQVRMGQAVSDLADLNPYPVPQSAAEGQAQAAPAAAEKNGDQQGLAGKALTQPPPRGIDQAEWVRLNEQLRQAIRSSGVESFGAEHQAAIRAYFERLSADSQKPKSSK
jgi:hypothetical protein